MFGSNFRDFISQDTTSHGQSNPERLIKNWHGFEKPDSEDSSIEEEFEILESKNQGGAKGRYHSGDSGIEGEKEFKISGDRSQPEDKLQCSSSENGYEIIEVSDLDKIQIAGFSKQELLEVCNFCKISYGNNDEKLDSRYKTKAELINEGYGITPFYYKKNGTLAGFVFTKDKEITIAYRDTKNLDDVMTDVSAAFTQEFLPEGGKMHSGFYNAFYDLLPSLDKVLSDYIEKQESEIKDFRINCTGHSMGAALATITALYLKKVKSAEHVRVATFGSPRVFDSRGAEIYERLLGENTIRVTNLSDPIPMFPTGSMGFKHIGEPLKIKTGNLKVNCLVTDLHIVGKYYHKTDTYYGCIQDMKPEDFQLDSNRSRYYYFSYVAAVPYYIITTALTTPCYLFHSAISNTEQRYYFERKMEFADLISHKNGFNAMVGEDPLIMSHIECNINGRGEVPLYINNNRNSMELRQLCGTENVSVRFPSSIGADLVAGGSLAMRSTCSNSGLSQQPQKNIVDKRKNVIDNKRASRGKPFGDNCEGIMFSYRQKQKVRATQQDLQQKIPIQINILGYINKELQKSLKLGQSCISSNGYIPHLSSKGSSDSQPTNMIQSSFGYTLPQTAHTKDTIAKTSNAQNLQVATSGVQQVVLYDETLSKLFGNNANEFTVHISEIAQKLLNNKIQKIKLPTSNGHIIFDLNVINEASPEGSQNIVKVLTDLYKNGALNDRTRNAIGTGAQDDVEGYRLFSEEDPILTPTLVPTPNPILTSIPGQVPTSVPPVTSENSATLSSPQPPVVNKKSEQANDTQTNSKLPNNPGNGSITATQNTQKSKWPTVATWTFAVAGILAGAAAPAAYFAFSVSLLTTGIIAGVGACCLVAAAVIYCCTPKSSVESKNVTKFTGDEFAAQQTVN